MRPGKADYLKHGDWSALCDECGIKFKASQLRKRWDGYMVCSADWEPRHPQDFPPVAKDDSSVPWTREQPEPTYVVVGPIDPDSL